MHRERIGRVGLIAFCAPALAVKAIGMPMSIYLPEFYSRAIGLDVAQVGLAFMCVRILDMMLDPMIGVAMDRTRTRHGRFRPWLAASAPVLTAGIALLFLARPGASLAYLWLSLMLTFAGYSMITLAGLSWAAGLSADPRERARIFTYWQILTTIGQLGVLATPAMAARVSQGDAAAGVHAMGYLLIVMIPVCVLIAVLSRKEARAPDAPRVKARGALLKLLGRPGVARLLTADFAMGLAIGLVTSLMLFFMVGQLHLTREAAALITMLNLAATLAGAPFIGWLAARLGTGRALVWGALGCAGGLVLAAGAPADAPLYVAFTSILVGFCTPAMYILPRAMMADVSDAARRLTGEDHTALLMSLLHGSMKLAFALSVGGSLILLDAAGFDANDAGAPEHEMLLRIMGGFLPAALFVIAALAVWRYPYRVDRLNEIRAAKLTASTGV